MVAGEDDLFPSKSAHAKAHTTKESSNKINKGRNGIVEKPVEKGFTVRTNGWERALQRKG